MTAVSPKALVDFMGLLAYAELAAFTSLAADAQFAPTIQDRVSVSQMAVAEFAHYQFLTDWLVGRGLDPWEAMSPFAAAIDAYQSRTQPTDWPEALMKIYVTQGITSDWWELIAAKLDADMADVAHQVNDEELVRCFVEPSLVTVLTTRPDAAGRAAMWGRRIVGEVVSQVQRLIADRPALMNAMAPDGPHAGTWAGANDMLTTLLQRHQQRVERLPLAVDDAQ